MFTIMKIETVEKLANKRGFTKDDVLNYYANKWVKDEHRINNDLLYIREYERLEFPDSYRLNSLQGLESQANFGARQDGKYKVVSTSPSVNKTPRGSSTPSISYDVQEDLGGASNVSTSVFFNSKGAYVKNSNSTKVTGDEPGTKKGVKSGTLSAQSDPLEHSSSVFINGQEVIRVNDVQYMQGKNTLGKVVSDESGQKPAISDDGKIIGNINKPTKELFPNKNKPSNNTTQTGALGSFRGSPVILKNGMSYVADTDITLKSIIDIDLIRVYISDDYKSGFGNGWRMVYDNRFINTKDNIFVLYTTDGLKYRFEMVDGKFEDMDNLGVDIDVCNDTYTITYTDKTSHTYKNSQLTELCDKNGNCLEFIYDKNSLLTTIKSLEASLEFTYNPKGLIYTIQDHSGRVFAYRYDTGDNLIQVIYPNQTTKRYSYIQTISGKYYISEVINQLDLVTLSFTYDNDNKVQSYANTQESFSYQYEPNRVIKTSNDAQKTFYKLDDFGAILAITYADKTTANEDYDIDTNSSWIKNRANKKSFYKYDDKNRVVLSQTHQENIVYRYMDDTKFVSTANIDNKITSYTYDDSYNITQIIHPNATQEKFTYDKHGNILTHADTSNLTKSYSYNNQGTIISISDEANTNEYFEYDEIGRVVSYVQKSGIIEVYKYDMMDNITHVFKDGLLFVAFGYDKANRLLSISDHMDNTTYFKYDNFTLSQIIHPNQTTTKYTITQDKTSITLPNQTTLQYEYDKHTKKLTKLTTPNMQISYKYDKFGNILSATDDTYSLSYVYDNNAKVLRSSYDDKDIVYSYDENELFYMGFEDRSFYCSRDKPNNTLTIQTNSLDKFEFVYDTQDNIVSLKYPNDFTMINKYTNLSKLCFSTTPNKELSYIYDNNNQIVSHNDIRYKYDSNQRLIKSNDKSYSYDLSNNLLSYNSIYDTITNQLISNDIYECNYDILGNMTQKHNKQTNITTYYKYDDLSRLIEYKQIDNTSNDTIKEINLSYNPLSQRASKHYKDKDESYYHKYIYDKHNIIGIYDARSDELLASFIHILDNIDRPLSITTNKGRYYYHLDINNSVIAISNNLGEIVQSFTYDDFGYIIDKYTHLESKELEVLNPYAYTSREYDSEELYYYRARYYDPTIQRFITPDPISYLSKDINFYAYVSNNPINLTDPSGLSPQVDIPNLDILSNIYGKNIAKDLPKNSFIDILTPPTSPTNAEPMGKDGFKVRGDKPKLDIGKTLYFVFYTKGGTKNDSIFQDTAKARVKYIKEDTLYCKDTDIVYLLEANKTSQILSLVKEKVAKHGGEEKTIIRSIEVFAELAKQHSKKETPLRQQPWYIPQPYIPNNLSIDEARNTINNNVLKQDKIHEQQTYEQDKFLKDLKNGTITGLKWVETFSTVASVTTFGKTPPQIPIFFAISGLVAHGFLYAIEETPHEIFLTKLTFDTTIDVIAGSDKRLQIANELIIKPYFSFIIDNINKTGEKK